MGKQTFDISQMLHDWPYEPGEVRARLVRTSSGRRMLQMRVEMGVLEMEIDGRPDGTRPRGADTYLDCLLAETFACGEEFELSEEQCMEVDRELVQYHQRRLCWLALREYRRAMNDAEYTMRLMDFADTHSSDVEWTRTHNLTRPLVIFHRTQAATFMELEASVPQRAIAAIERGLADLHNWFEMLGDDESADADEIVSHLLELEDWIRANYRLERNLSEQLAEAIASEQYELAARLRDEIARRTSRSA